MCKTDEWMEVIDSEVRAFFCMKRETARSKEVATKFCAGLSDIPEKMWQEGIKALAIREIDDLLDMQKKGCVATSVIIAYKKTAHKFIHRFTYMGSDIKSKDRGHCYMWEAKRNPEYIAPRTDDPQ